MPGVGLSGNNILGIVAATNAQIDSKTTKNPITPINLDYAIKSGLTTNTLEFTDEEKKAARELIGAGTGDGSGEGGNVFIDEDGYLVCDGESEGESSDVVRYTEQTLTDEQKFQARANIGAASEEVVSKLSEDKADKENTYTKAEVDEIVQNLPSGGSETWRTIREFEISNEEGITNDTSGITWTVDESGNITAFLIETDSNGNAFSASKLRYAIYPQAHDKAIFGGKKGYLTVSCNGYGSSIYNATAVIAGHRIQGNVECDMSGILRHIIYMGADRNSYGNERPHLNYFNSAGKGYTTPPITRFRVGCDSGIWFVQGAKVLVQICEEV